VFGVGGGAGGGGSGGGGGDGSVELSVAARVALFEKNKRLKTGFSLYRLKG
jgi:hypothetical protein